MRLIWTTALAGVLTACGGPMTPLTVVAEPDERIEAGDWVVDITQWTTVIDHIQMSNRRGRVIGDDGETSTVVDFLDVTYPVELATFDVRATTATLNFGVEPPLRDAARATRFISDLDVVNMEANGWTHLIQGRAFGPSDVYSKTPVYTFDLQFDSLVRNLGCGDIDVVAGEANELTIRTNMDAWLWSSLTEPDPEVSFIPLTFADRDRDLTITVSELQNTSLAAAGLEGDAPNLYQYLRETLKYTLEGPTDCDTRN